MVQGIHKNLVPTKNLKPLKQNGHGRANVRGSASVCHKTREYSRSIRCGSGNEGDSKRPFAAEVSHVCTLLLKKGGGIHCRVTGRQTCTCTWLIYIKETLE